MLIHIHRNGEQFGPYTLEDLNSYLAQGALLPTDQAWWEGGPGWVSMDQVPGVLLPGGSSNAVVAPTEGRRSKLMIAGIVSSVLVLGALGVVFLGGDKDSEEKPGGDLNSDLKGGGQSGVVIQGGADGAFAKVEPIFRKYRCFDCHHSKESGKAEADLDFSVPVTTRAFTSPNQAGNPATAPLILAITPGAGRPMPPNGPMISEVEVEAIKRWIGSGAKF